MSIMMAGVALCKIKPNKSQHPTASKLAVRFCDRFYRNETLIVYQLAHRRRCALRYAKK